MGDTKPVNTPLSARRAFNPKLEGVSTDELVQELIDRKQAQLEQLQAVVALFPGAAAAASLSKGAASARALPALPPAPKHAPKARPAPSAAAVPDGTSLNERIVGVLIASEGQPLRTAEITERLVQAGWTTASPKPATLVAQA
jgi:hypothetical protein